jgi:hypothetical protein
LSFKDGDTRVVLHCFTGQCPAESIVRAVGLTMADLSFTTNGAQPSGSAKPVNSSTAATGKQAKPEGRGGRRSRRHLDYRDGRAAAVQRCATAQDLPHAQAGWKDWTWNLKGVRRVIYKLDP